MKAVEDENLYGEKILTNFFSRKMEFFKIFIISSYIFALHLLVRKNSKIWLKKLFYLIIISGGIAGIKC
jgi:hypothetical protein